MIRFTIWIYRFFNNHKALFYTLLTVSAIVFAYFGSKIKFEEDISRLLPAIKENGVEKLAFSELKVKDKIFILFTGKSGKLSPDDLLEACDEFTEKLLEKDSTNTLIAGIFNQIEDDALQNGINFLYENAPVFLNSDRYRLIDSLLDDRRLEQQMAENYSSLTSAAGMAFKDIITLDPIGLRNIFMDSGFGGSSALGGNYKLYANHIFTPDTAVAIAFLSPNFKAWDSQLATQLVKTIKREAGIFMSENPDIEILYHGTPVQSVSNADRIREDLALTISISLLLTLILLMICFKNKSTLFYLLVPVVYGVIFALAMMYFIKGSMSIMALGIGAIVLGVAFSYCLHVICHYKYVSEPEQILKDQTIPVILGSLTTIGAFMGLILTDSELLHDFGWFASLALVGTTTFALLCLPQFFRPERNRKSEKAFAVLEKINSYPFEKKRLLIAIILIISVICYITSDRVKFDSNLRHIGYNNAQLVRSHDLLASKTTENQATFYFAAVAGDLDSALTVSHKLNEQLGELKAKGEIPGYSALSAMFIPVEEQNRRIEQWNEYWTDEQKELVRSKIIAAAGKYRFSENTFEPFFEMLETEYEPVSLYEAEILPEAMLNNIIEQVDSLYLVFTPVFIDKEQLWEVGSKFAGNSNFLVIDPIYYANDMVKTIHNDFNTTLTVSSLFVLFVLLISFGNLLISILAFIPMGLSWYIVLGSMSIFGMEFNLINIIISSFIFGVGVDYSIFIMDGLLAKYRSRQTLLVYHKTAIFFSAVILIAVIVSLLFAVHPAIQSIGVATLIGMTATILISYSLQPFMFSLLVSGRADKGKAPFSVSGLFCRKQSVVQELKNNYLYKGNTLEINLRKELRSTGNYALLSEMLTGKKSLLDYGCGYGFTSYWAALNDNQLNITGVDSDSAALALAANCYKKIEQLRFISELSETDEFYDIIIINKKPDEESLKILLTKTQTLIVRRSVSCNFEGFKECKSDKIFAVYEAL